jgi:hypothetical protein
MRGPIVSKSERSGTGVDMANLSKAVCHGESDKCRFGNSSQGVTSLGGNPSRNELAIFRPILAAFAAESERWAPDPVRDQIRGCACLQQALREPWRTRRLPSLQGSKGCTLALKISRRHDCGEWEGPLAKKRPWSPCYAIRSQASGETSRAATAGSMATSGSRAVAGRCARSAR